MEFIGYKKDLQKIKIQLNTLSSFSVIPVKWFQLNQENKVEF